MCIFEWTAIYSCLPWDILGKREEYKSKYANVLVVFRQGLISRICWKCLKLVEAFCKFFTLNYKLIRWGKAVYRVKKFNSSKISMECDLTKFEHDKIIDANESLVYAHVSLSSVYMLHECVYLLISYFWVWVLSAVTHLFNVVLWLQKVLLRENKITKLQLHISSATLSIGREEYEKYCSWMWKRE